MERVTGAETRGCSWGTGPRQVDESPDSSLGMVLRSAPHRAGPCFPQNAHLHRLTCQRPPLALPYSDRQGALWPVPLGTAWRLLGEQKGAGMQQGALSSDISHAGRGGDGCQEGRGRGQRRPRAGQKWP